MRNQSVEEKLAERLMPVPESGCWLWTGHLNRGGYGHVRSGDKMVRVHRASWEVHVGPIPDGLLVCHKCDTRSCGNPDHLFLGTHKDNSMDMWRKGRAEAIRESVRVRASQGVRSGVKGASPNAKLTWDQANQIREAVGLLKEIARKFGVSPSAVSKIKTGVRWNVRDRPVGINQKEPTPPAQ